jgi:molybdenum cofactor cytidylyltransferase
LNQDLGVILLGAGASSRMGRPKLLMPWGTTSVVGHLISQWRQLGAAQIAIVCRSIDNPLHTELDRLGFSRSDRIENPESERGMFSSILCAANWSGWESSVNTWAISLGDQPHLRLETLARLLEFQKEHQNTICQPSYENRAKHPVLLPRAAFEELRNTHANTLKEFLQNTSCPLATHPLDDPGLAMDLDTPEDYERAVRLFNESR